LVENLTISDYLEMQATDQQNYVRLKSHIVTIPTSAPILRIDQGLWVYKDLFSLGYLASASKTDIPIQSGGYTPCVPSDIGKQVRDDGVIIPDVVLASYDNSDPPNRKWFLTGPTSVASGSAMTVVNGTGAGTSSGASSVYGGGAIMIGHGLTGSTDPAKIILMDSAQGYDTLFLKKRDGTAAKLNVGKLEIQSTNNVFAITAGDNGVNQDTYIVPQNPSQGGLGLGTSTYPFKWVDATYVFTNAITSLSGGAISISVSLDCNTVIHGGGSSGDAFKVGDDIFLVDVNNANRLALQGAQDRTQAGIQFGSGGMWLYRDSAYLRCSSGSGFVVDGYIVAASWANTTQYGPLYRNSSGQIGYNISSERFKDNINTVDDCSWIYNLRPVTFDWKEKERAKAEGTQLGLIAEEVHKQYPQLTWLDSEGKPEGVHYEWLGVPLIVEIKKLHKRIETLEDQFKKKQAAT